MIMELKILFITGIFLLLISGCTKKNVDGFAEVIPVVEIDGLVNDTSFLDSASLFIPETKQNALIHGADRIIENEDRFLILDMEMKQVLGYAKSGKHLFTIHAVGGAPGEYVNLFDMAIDRQAKRLLLLTYPPAIQYYTFDGVYERTERLEAIYKSLAVTDQYIYLRKETYANNHLSDYSLLAIENEIGHRHSLWKPLPEIAPFCTFGTMSMTGNDPVYLTRKFDNTIYATKDGLIEEGYIIGWGDKAFPDTSGKRTYTCEELNEICRENKYVYTMTDLCDMPGYLLFRTNQPGLCVLSKEKKEVKNYHLVMNTDYQLVMPNFIPVEGGGGRIFFIYPSDVLKMSVQADGKHPNDNLSCLLEQISEESNPVFFSYFVK